MWDKTLSASYSPKRENTSTQVPVDSSDSEPKAALSFFTRFKAYIIPAIFVVCLIIVAYILWKYFTKYRNTKITTGDGPPMELTTESKLQDPLTLIKSQDMSKYEVDSDEDDEDIKKRVLGSSTRPMYPDPAMPVLPEIGESDDDEDDTQSSDEEKEDMQVEEPDLAKIEKLIMSTTGDMPLLEDDEPFPSRVASYITEITEEDEKTSEEPLVPSYITDEDDPSYISEIIELKENAKPKRHPRKNKPITL